MKEIIITKIDAMLRHPGLRLYGKNLGWLFLEKAFRLFLGLGVGVYVARELTPAGYGLLNYAISLTAIFAVSMSFGLESLLVRELVNHPRLINLLLGTAFRLKCYGYLLMLATLGGILIWNARGEDPTTVKVTAILAFGYLFQTLQPLELYFQSRILSKYVVLSQIAALTLTAAAKLWFAYRKFPLEYFAWTESAYMLLTTAGYWFFYGKCGNAVKKWKYCRAIAKSLFFNGLPFWLSSMAGLIYMRIDQVMLKSFLGDTAVGYYSVANRWVELFYFIPMLICSSFLPALLRAKQVSEEWFYRRLQLLTGALFYMAAALFVVLWFAAPLLTVLYGEAYAPSVVLLRIYAVVLFFIFTGAPGAPWYVATNNQRWAIVASVISALLNIALNWLLIPAIGAKGAAYAILGSYLSMTIFGLIIKDLRRITLMRFTAPLLLWKELRVRT